MSITSTIAQLNFTVSFLPETFTVFPFDTSADFSVSDGAKVLTLNSDYTVSGGGYNSANQLQTGTITILSPGSGIVQVGDIITAYRNQSPQQQTTFSSTGLLTPLMIEQDDDRLTTFDQQLLLAYFNPFPPIKGTTNGIFLGWITADTGGITTSIDSLNVVSITGNQLPLVIAVSIGDDWELWKLRPMQIGDPNASLAGAFIVPVVNPNSLIWVRVG